ncbi:NAD(P)-binding protein [Gracilaria domingensis]|nr:NAD(P)-binding protein [Gracilaria domingensis]
MTLDVILTGAAGRTGRIVFEKLQSDPSNFSVTGLVRNIESASKILPSTENLVEGDITKPETLEEPFAGKDALIILTSAVPRIIPAPEGTPPQFKYDEDGMPEFVDWLGAKNQIDTAIRLGLRHVIMVGSMGSTDDNNPLNRLGNGNILRFKRKAELYLIESGIPYTIINPAGLSNEPEQERELVVGRNDDLFTVFEKGQCSIPRADVARVVVSALLAPNSKKKAMDVAARPKGDGSITESPVPLFDLVGAQI